MDTDLIGTALTPQETVLLAIYDRARTLLADDALAPTTRANLLVAVSALGVAVTELGLRLEHLTDIGA